MVTPTSKVSFNDVQFGFVPHAGSSYYLSRLPGELGTYLALTGATMHAGDAIYAKLADQLVHNTKDTELQMINIGQATDWPVATAFLTSNRWQDDGWSHYAAHREEYQDLTLHEFMLAKSKKH